VEEGHEHSTKVGSDTIKALEHILPGPWLQKEFDCGGHVEFANPVRSLNEEI
jgi:hypothetical protein